MARVSPVTLISILAMFSIGRGVVGADPPQIRIICQTEWRDDLLPPQPAPESGRTLDIALPLSDIPAEASAGQLLRLAEKKAGVRAPTDFINTVRVYRPQADSSGFQRVDRRRLRDTTRLPALHAGDLVVFHGIVDRF
jgi:hypothetical protein